MQKVLSSLFISLIYIYKYAFSSLFLPACRFSPTCSEYGIQAIRKHGPFKGGILTIKRIASCHPWGRHGHDPVP